MLPKQLSLSICYFVGKRPPFTSLRKVVLVLISSTDTYHGPPKNPQCILCSDHCYCWWHAVRCILACFFAAITLTFDRFGFDISSISATIGTDQYVDYFNNPHGIVQGGIGAALAGGSVIGAIMAGPVSNKIGRRDAIGFACLWWLLGTSIQAGCNGIGMLVAGKLD